MTEDATSQLRITTWPGTRLPVFPVKTTRVFLSAGDEFVFSADKADQNIVQPPDELFLREFMTLDVADLQELGRFQQSFGRLAHRIGIPHTGTALGPILVGEQLPLLLLGKLEDEYHENNPGAPSRSDDPESAGYELGQMSQSVLDEYRDEPMETHEAQLPSSMFTQGGQDSYDLVQPAIWAWACAIALRDAIRVWLYDSGMLTGPELKTEWEGPEPPRNRRQALDYLASVLTAGLSPYHPLAICSASPQADNEDLYGVLCLQLYNQISEAVPPERCGNYKCKQAFVRQRGRSKKGIHRLSGVNYCSIECARAQAQRDLRTNRAAAARLARQGLTVLEIADKLEKEPGQVDKWLAALERRRNKN